MKVRFAIAAAGLLALAACDPPVNETNAIDNAEVEAPDETSVNAAETPAANAANAAAPEELGNAAGADAQTQEDAVATGMTARVDRGNESDAQ
jgi:hypothetical protein